MAKHKLTDTEIAIRICPKRMRWPASGTSVAWTKAHDCVDAFQDVIRKVDLGCLEAEHDREPSAGGIARRRGELCDQALRKLVNLPAFEIAERALFENIVATDARWDGRVSRLAGRWPE